MSELERLAALAGIQTVWTDAFDAPQRVPPETVRGVLRALGLGCDTPGEIADAIAQLAHPQTLPPLLTADPGVRIALPDGATHIAPTTPGYHSLRIGDAQTTLAVAPAQARSVRQMTGRARAFGSAVQIYGLRRLGDGGIGDFGAVAEAAALLATHGADALAISPTHALFAAEPGRASPYAPSSRLALNPLLADPACLFPAAPPGPPADEAAALIDWPRAGQAKLDRLRALFADLAAHPQAQAAFADYVHTAREDVLLHATFEALHAAQLAAGGPWRWQDWPAGLRRPDSPDVAAFAAAHGPEVRFHVFLQFLAERSLDAAQARARAAGMGIGLIADLAVGMDPSGSHAWSRPQDVLHGLSVGAPPDLINRDGQGWGLTTFSPTALRAAGFAPFLATLRAALRHAGGVRIDHVMGLRRLWLVPDGASPTEGAYLDYPLDDLLRLVALESHRHDALVIGEDLGTVPPGFRATLSARGVLGMRVLPFERGEDGAVTPPADWQPDAVAMTSTHDLPPVAGWWRGRDLDWRARLRGDPAPSAAEQGARRDERTAFWRAATAAGAATSTPPAEPGPVVDAAIAYVAATPCALAIVPLEDLLALVEGPNLPGTTDEHPNWRRRLAAPVADALADPHVTARLAALARGRAA